MTKKIVFLTVSICFTSILSFAQNVDYKVVAAREESGTEFVKVTSNTDYVCMPEVRRSRNGIEWFSNRILAVHPDGENIAYVSFRDNSTNIFVKNTVKQGGSVQRTNRQAVIDFSYSPDGQTICFSEQRGDLCQIFTTNAASGYVCRQITSGSRDYTPIFSSDMSSLFFARQEQNGVSIWSFDMQNHFLSNYASGMNPCLIPGTKSVLCTRINSSGRTEIWKIDYENGIEECIVSGEHNYSTPSLSPDGKWIVFVGGTGIPYGNGFYYNTDLYACKVDGTQFTQLTFHAAEDLSPVWSIDGKFIFFISQRGDEYGAANIWRMNFNY